MQRLATLLLAALAVLLGVPSGSAVAAGKPPTPPYRCTVVPTPPKAAGPGATSAGAALPVVVAVPRLRCTGRNPQHPTGGVSGEAGGAGTGAVGNGDGHIPFTGFPMDVALAVSLTLVSCGALLVVLAVPRRRIA